MTEPNQHRDPLPDPPSTASVPVPGRARRPGAPVPPLAGQPGRPGQLVFLALVVLTAIFAPLLAPADPNAPRISDVLGPAGAGSPAGRRLQRPRRVVPAALCGPVQPRRRAAGAGVSLSVGTGGLFAGYYGSWFDCVSTWLAGLVMALPGIMVLLAARAGDGPVDVDLDGHLRRAHLAGLLPAGLRRGHRGARRALRRRRPGLRSLRRPDHRPAHPDRRPRSGHHPGRDHPGIAIAIQAGLEFLGLGDPTSPPGAPCSTTASPTSNQRRPDAVAEPGDRAHLHLPDPAGQRDARRARAQRPASPQDAASADHATARPGHGRRRSCTRPTTAPARPARCSWRSRISRSATARTTARSRRSSTTSR